MSMLVKAGLWSLVAALSVPVFLFGIYFLHGSLEQFPTDEQVGKAHLIAGFGFILFMLLEAIALFALLRGSRLRTGAAPSTTRAETDP